MARPRPDLPSGAALRSLIDGEGRLTLRVTPGARTEALAIEGGELLAKVRAKPQDGAANEAVIALVAKALGLAPSKVALLRGATSRNKQLRVDADAF